jgi:PAS domain S-box-containing protein
VFESVFEYIRDSFDDFLELFHKQLLQDRLVTQDLFQRQDALLLFHAHMSILDYSMQNQSCPPADVFQTKFPAEIDLFTDLIQRFKSHGLSPSFGLQYFRAVHSAMRQLILSLVFNEVTKINLLNLIHDQMSIIDVLLIDICEKSMKDQSVQGLEAVNLQLIREKATYKNIFVGTSNLVLITDGDGQVVEANPEALVFFSNLDLIGNFCGSPLGLSEYDLARLLMDFPPNQPHEVALTEGQARRYFNLQIKPLEKSLDVSHGIMLILSDITCIVDHRQMLEQKVLERTVALASSEKLLGALFHAVGKGIILIDEDGEIVKANQQASEIYGQPLEVLIGTPLCSLTDADGCLTLRKAKEQLIEGQQFQTEAVSLYVDGKPFPSIMTMTRMTLDDSPYWTLIVRDITEQKAMDLKLREEKLNAEEMNVTLRNVLKSIEDDRREFEQKLSERISSSILPGLAKISAEKQDEVRQGYLALLKDQLISLTGGFDSELDGDLLKLTKTELKICQFIKAGLSGKEICDAMNLSFETIQTHRKNIRKKLGLRGRTQSLHQFLVSRNCDF